MRGNQSPSAIALADDRVRKGQLLMAGLAEEIRGLWDTLSRIEAAPVPGGGVVLSPDSVLDVLNWLRRALTSIRSLDLEVFQSSDEQAYVAVRDRDPRGIAVKGLIAPRNNAVHHPEVVDPGVDRVIGPLGDDGRFLTFPLWVERTTSLDAMFTYRGQFSASYADAYDRHVAGRSLCDPLLDAFDFFDSLAPDLARRDASGQLLFFPLPAPPLYGTEAFFRLTPSSPNERKQRAALDVQQRFYLALQVPEGRHRVITGAIEGEDGELVLTGHTVVSDTYRHAFMETPKQIKYDVLRQFKYFVAVPATAGAEADEVVELTADLTLADRRELPIDALLAAEVSNVEVHRGRWELCQKDANYYAGFRRPNGRWPRRSERPSPLG